jgi:cytochrome c oxidase subunit 2
MSFADLVHAHVFAGHGSGWAISARHALALADDKPGNIFAPQATPAHTIFGLSLLVLAITLAIFLAVGGLLAYAIYKFRHRPGDQGEPAQVYGSNQIEVLWTVVPILILVVLFLATMRVINGTEKARKPANALDVVVIGHQFWWEYRYPKLGIVTANELHIPVSDLHAPQPSYLTLTSADVDHSFWVPRLAGKMDLIPNKVNVMWMDPEKPGLYLGQCAQYCGAEHAQMLIRVYVDTPEQFRQWVAAQQKPAVDDPAAAAGKEVFLHTSCVNCHTVNGTEAHGKFGPDLTHLASRETFASGIVPNTRENLRKWIADPDSLKTGSLMPRMNLTARDLDLITAYMASLR